MSEKTGEDKLVTKLEHVRSQTFPGCCFHGCWTVSTSCYDVLSAQSHNFMQACWAKRVAMCQKKWISSLTGRVVFFIFFIAYAGLQICWLCHKNVCHSDCHTGGKGGTASVSLTVQWCPTNLVSSIIAVRLWTPSDANLGEGMGYVLSWGLTDRKRYTGRDLVILSSTTSSLTTSTRPTAIWKMHITILYHPPYCTVYHLIVTKSGDAQQFLGSLTFHYVNKTTPSRGPTVSEDGISSTRTA